MLLNECEDADLAHVITENVLMAAAKNTSNAVDALSVLLLEDGARDKATPMVLMTARTESHLSRETMQHLMGGDPQLANAN